MNLQGGNCQKLELYQACRKDAQIAYLGNGPRLAELDHVNLKRLPGTGRCCALAVCQIAISTGASQQDDYGQSRQVL